MVFKGLALWAFSLGPAINSTYSELSPVLSDDGKLLFFCREGDPKNRGYLQRKHDQDIWIARRMPTGTFSEPEHIDAAFNSRGFDFPVAFFSATQTLYVGNTYTPDGKSAPGISKSKLENGKFTFPEALAIEDFYNDVNLASYSVGSDEKTLLLSLKRKDSKGKSDLYVSFLKDDGKWSKPLNLGDDINTTDAELSPYLADDMRTIYFASNREGGLGKFDLYMARREDDSYLKWTKPVNLGKTINSSGSDISIAFSATGDQAILSSDKKSSNKNLRIVSVPEKFRPLKPIIVSGIVSDIDGEELEADVLVEILGTGKTIARTKSNDTDGKFTLKLERGKRYGLHAEKDKYAPVSATLDLSKKNLAPQGEIHLSLVPLAAGNKIQLNNVFFAPDSAELRKQSHSELNRLVLLMKANASLRIEIGGHTDSVGSNEVNKRLSAERAEAVRNYLIAHGVDKNHIMARGYAATRPVATPENKKDRKLNRRVEFHILEF